MFLSTRNDGIYKYLNLSAKKNAEKQINVIKSNYPITTDNKEAKVVKIKIIGMHITLK